jgi:hypothetical protein
MPINVGRSAKLYQERRLGYIQPTMRGPGPHVYLPDNAVHDLRLEPPLPDPSAIDCTPVDTGQTEVWPHGDETAI